MTIFQKSIHKELIRNFGGSTVILFAIVMTIMLIRILGQSSKGQADPSEVILLIGLERNWQCGPNTHVEHVHLHCLYLLKNVP
jgi:hypothetical protein